MATADDRGPDPDTAGNTRPQRPKRPQRSEDRAGARAAGATGLYRPPNMRALALSLVVLAVIAAYLAGQWSAGPGGLRAPDVSQTAEPWDDEDAQQLEAFLERYFGSWSAQDMEAYRDCFHPRATIHHIDHDGRVTMQRLDDFIAGQRAGHARSPERMVEVPLWHRVDPGLKAVQVHVRWHLTAGQREVLGRNHYTLQRGGEHGFQIINLVFYGEEETESEG